MGYDVHITRADNWADNDGCAITIAEWQSLIANDPELCIDDQNGFGYAIWKAHPDNLDIWLCWDDGNISTKNPDEPLLKKMIQIAERLGARVQGDDGEWYPQNPPAAVASRSTILTVGSIQSFVLSLVVMVGFVALYYLNIVMIQSYPNGTPRPLVWVLPLGIMIVLTFASWVASCLLAIHSLLNRLPLARFAYAALVMNALWFLILYLSAGWRWCIVHNSVPLALPVN
jgi:hypothetical protein